MSKPGSSSPARASFPELDSELETLGCDAILVVASSASVPDLARYVRGVHLGSSYLLLRRRGTPTLAYSTSMERDEAHSTGLELLRPEDLGYGVLRDQGMAPGLLWAEWIASGAEAVGLSRATLGLAGQLPSGDLWQCCEALREKGFRFVPANETLRRSRKTKTPWELAEIRRSAGATCEAFRRVAEVLGSAVTSDGSTAVRSLDGPRGCELFVDEHALRVGSLRAAVQAVFAAHGLEQPKGNIIAPAEQGGVPHNTGSDDRVIRSGETVVVDLFPKGHLFADCTRTFCVGQPSEVAERAYTDVRDALDLAWQQTQVGKRGWEGQVAVCELFRSRGHSNPIDDPEATSGYVHGLGHGVGFDIHEFPSFSRSAQTEGQLELGDVLTIEPGLYSEQEGYGIRLEDLVWLGPQGPENLTDLPYEMDPQMWVQESGSH